MWKNKQLHVIRIAIIFLDVYLPFNTGRLLEAFQYKAGCISSKNPDQGCIHISCNIVENFLNL
jgi:hypothetical protein